MAEARAKISFPAHLKQESRPDAEIATAKEEGEREGGATWRWRWCPPAGTRSGREDVIQPYGRLVTPTRGETLIRPLPDPADHCSQNVLTWWFLEEEARAGMPLSASIFFLGLLTMDDFGGPGRGEEGLKCIGFRDYLTNFGLWRA